MHANVKKDNRYDTFRIFPDTFGINVFYRHLWLPYTPQMLNATDINFAVFNRLLYPTGQEGYFFALFSIAISAAETAIAIAIMIAIYRNVRSIQLKHINTLKW